MAVVSGAFDNVADPRRYFISHASPQKELALGIHAHLGERAWVDLHEIDVGDVLLDEISDGIEAATDFVLLWSEASASSAWVKYELHMAFIRYLEDRAIALRVVPIDDTPVPLFLRPLLQARGLSDPAEIAAVLCKQKPRPTVLRRFLNRAAEIQVAEDTLYSPTKGFVWFFGLSGIGKRSLAREAQRRLVADPLRRVTIRVRPGTAFAELHLSLCAAAQLDPPAGALSESEAADACSEIIRELTTQGALCSFEEAQHWLDEDARPNPVLKAVLDTIAAAGVQTAERAALFTSTRRPRLDHTHEVCSEFKRVAGLASDYALALMRPHVPLMTSDEDLRIASRQLEGHPLALQLAASRMHATPPDWEGLRFTTAQGILGELMLRHDTQRLLEALATVNGPLPGAALAQHLGLEEDAFREAVDDATSYCLVHEDSGFLYIHPLVRDFFTRMLKSQPDRDARLADLAEWSRATLEQAKPGSAVYVDSLFATFRLLSLSGRLDKAMELHSGLFGTLMETAIDLYNEKQYELALRYFEAVIESTADDERAKLFMARTLAYLGRGDEARQLVDRLLADRPNHFNLLRVRGRIEFILRNWDAALAYFEQARVQKPTSAPLLRDIGQVNIRLERWEEARIALQAAVQVPSPDPYTAFYYSQVLEHFREFDEARTVMEMAVRLDPRRAPFHHRLGRIAQAQGNIDEAKRQYLRAIEIEPGYAEPLVTLASVLTDEGSLARARELLTRAQNAGGVRPVVLHTIEAKVQLAEGDIRGAQTSIDAALKHEREPESLLLAARIALRSHELGQMDGAHAQAHVEPLLAELAELSLFNEAEELRRRLPGPTLA